MKVLSICEVKVAVEQLDMLLVVLCKVVEVAIGPGAQQWQSRIVHGGTLTTLSGHEGRVSAFDLCIPVGNAPDQA